MKTPDKIMIAGVSSGNYTVVKYSDDSYAVFFLCNPCENTRGTLRHLAEEVSFEYDPKWTTRQFGAKLSEYLKSESSYSKKNVETVCNLDAVKEVFNLLEGEVDVSDNSGFSAGKEAIMQVFKTTSDCLKQDIFIRLALIDSMYSTQMNRRYNALDELAGALEKLSKGKEGRLKQLFLDFAINPDRMVEEFNYDEINLFSESYGIGKDGEDKGIAISLISKYAYFETGFKFPIYDSIACEMYPLVWKSCGFGDNRPQWRISANINNYGLKTMVEYVKAINVLIVKLGLNHNEKKYDHLDRFLWFVGKIRRGNLSLVLSREDYKKTIAQTKSDVTIISTNGEEKTYTEYFNINKVNLDDWDYLKNNILLRKFFELAKYYSKK